METSTTKDLSLSRPRVIRNEDELFDYLKNRYFPDLKKAKDKMEKYDCFSKKYRTVIELKCRRSHYDQLMMEKMKYDKLIAMNWRALYINSTPLGVFAFNVKDIEPNWITDNRMPDKTDLHIFREEKQKTYTLLHISKATEI